MVSNASTVADYLAELPAERRLFVEKMRQTISENLPEGFVEAMSYGHIGFVVPKSIYPAGYHCDAKLPLPFASVASQKNSVNLYHMGLYADTELLEWFRSEWPKRTKAKLDMGKSCIRFAKMEAVPFDLLAELMQKMTVERWIGVYETAFRRA